MVVSAMEILQFTFRIEDFDLNLLPIDPILLSGDEELLRDAITSFFVEHFQKIGGRADVRVVEEEVQVSWRPNSLLSVENLRDFAFELLKRKDWPNAGSILEVLLDHIPEDFQILHNYGMALSDAGDLKRAIELLRKATTISPKNPDTWNALGVALHRMGDLPGADRAFQQSLDLAPGNPFTLKNYGAMVAKLDPAKGLPYLKQATELLPEDQPAQYGLGLCLFQLERFAEADDVLKRTINLAPYSGVAEHCKQLRTKIAVMGMRDKGIGDGGLRMDVVMYCLGAIQKFEQFGPEKMKEIVFEIALLGRNGLDINDPEPKYTLQTLPGKFSGLQLSAYLYVGFQRIDPSIDVGVDYSEEYRMARTIDE